jgi:hypothetical protein
MYVSISNAKYQYATDLRGKATAFLRKYSLRKKAKKFAGRRAGRVAACGRLAGLRESNRRANLTPRLPSIESSTTF